MGLDMEIRRISKPHMDDSVIYNHEAIRGIILTEDNLKEPMYRQLAPYVQPLKVRIQYCDMGKIRKDYGLTDYSYIGMMSAYCTAITDEGTHKSVEISTEDIDKKYTIERVEKRFVCNSEEVCCWRKAYDIQDWFHKNIDCVTMRLSRKMQSLWITLRLQRMRLSVKMLLSVMMPITHRDLQSCDDGE